MTHQSVMEIKMWIMKLVMWAMDFFKLFMMILSMVTRESLW